MSWRKRVKESLIRDWPSYAVITLGAVVGLFLITRSLDFLLTNLLPDDAFYYFEIARNIVHGLGSTFDGIHPTNGYHPLWLIILLPIFKLFSIGGTYDLVPIRVALGLSVVFSVGTGIVLLSLLSRITEDRVLRALGVALWVLNPFVLYESLNGLETSLALFLMSLFFLMAVRAAERDTLASFAWAGLVGGLMVLARVDMAFYVIAFFVWIVLRKRMHSLVPLLYAGIPAALVTLPWFLWNFFVFHMALTSASGGTQLVNHALVAIDNHGMNTYIFTKTIAYMLINYSKGVLSATGMPILFILGVIAACVLFFKKEILVPRLRDMPVLVVLFGGFLLLFFANAGLRWTAREWYFISFDFFVALGIVTILALLAARFARQRSLLYALVALIAAGSFVVGWNEDLRDNSANQRTMYLAAQSLRTNLPAGEPVGIFNAGIIGYFSGREVVNLDGLVNNSSYDALQQHALWMYLADNHIRYLSDFGIYFSYRYKSFFGVQDLFKKLTPVGTIALPGAKPNAAITVYQVLAR